MGTSRDVILKPSPSGPEKNKQTKKNQDHDSARNTLKQEQFVAVII